MLADKLNNKLGNKLSEKLPVANETVDLSDEDLVKLGGGYLRETADGTWQVIDKLGKVVATTEDEDAAYTMARDMGLSTLEVSDNVINLLRKHNL